MSNVQRHITLVEPYGSLACGHHPVSSIFPFSHVYADADANVDVDVGVDVCSFFAGCVEGPSDFTGQ